MIGQRSTMAVAVGAMRCGATIKVKRHEKKEVGWICAQRRRPIAVQRSHSTGHTLKKHATASTAASMHRSTSQQRGGAARVLPQGAHRFWRKCVTGGLTTAVGCRRTPHGGALASPPRSGSTTRLVPAEGEAALATRRRVEARGGAVSDDVSTVLVAAGGVGVGAHTRLGTGDSAHGSAGVGLLEDGLRGGLLTLRGGGRGTGCCWCRTTHGRRRSVAAERDGRGATRRGAHTRGRTVSHEVVAVHS